MNTRPVKSDRVVKCGVTEVYIARKFGICESQTMRESTQSEHCGTSEIRTPEFRFSVEYRSVEGCPAVKACLSEVDGCLECGSGEINTLCECCTRKGCEISEGDSGQILHSGEACTTKTDPAESN
ncbi:hypothetical protein GCM10010423_45980 [Streptomyces levis]|uniref:Uncharacterized protein n=1 Tax=Streptomyces levis TaxID=285566 RepID=A0ABN3NW60_9ACTN